MNTVKIPVPGCKGTTVEKLLLENGLPVLKVEVEPGGEIPLHAHQCTATMIILSGKARTLGKEGRVVSKGDIIAKTPNEPHGFGDVEATFSFISISDNAGIMREDGWDVNYI